LAIAVKLARDGANIAIFAKTDTPDPRLPGTIHKAEIENAGGRCLALKVDIRKDKEVEAAVNQIVHEFGKFWLLEAIKI
jgi:citronellol/citronellal dehydrogenase